MLRSHLWCLVVDDLEWFGSAEVLDASAFVRFNDRMKRTYRTTSLRQSSIWLKQMSLLVPEGTDLR